MIFPYMLGNRDKGASYDKEVIRMEDENHMSWRFPIRQRTPTTPKQNKKCRVKTRFFKADFDGIETASHI